MTKALLAFAVTLVVCPAVMALLRRRQMLDTPNERSSHATPTLRGGGLAVMAGATIVASVGPGRPATGSTALLFTAMGFGFIGLADDLADIPAGRRLVAQLVVAAASLPFLLQDLSGPSAWRWVFAAGVLLWLLSYVNAFNFMDGINGLASVQAIVAGSVWWAIGAAEGVALLAWGGAILVGAVGGFAPFNFPRARVFLGDVGSYFVGAWMAVLGVAGIRAGLPPEAMLAPLALALVDTAFTLVRRVLRREPPLKSHADHVYQRLARAFRSHTRATLAVGGLIAACSGLGALTLPGRSPLLRPIADILILCVLAAYLLSPRLVAVAWFARPAGAIE